MARPRYEGRVSFKGPTERLDHSVDWSDVLEPLDDWIVDFSARIEREGGGESDMLLDGEQNTELDTTAWLILGTDRVSYSCFHTIRTAQDRVFCRPVRIPCRQ